MKFGHVGDIDTPAQKIAPEKVPVFDQTHVDYLKKVFNVGMQAESAKSMDDAIRVISFVATDNGNREVINHIQKLVNEKGAS